MSTRKKISGYLSLSVALMLTVFVAACGSGSDNSANTTSRTSANANSAASPATTTPAATTGAPAAKLNVNTASGADLQRTIPNFGNRMVHEFEEYRPYKSIQQFRKEIGKYVDQNQIAEYEKYIFVPIDYNQADAPTLQQVPGLDAGEAQELNAARPYASRDAFLAKLAEKISADELAVAKNYLAQP